MMASRLLHDSLANNSAPRFHSDDVSAYRFYYLAAEIVSRKECLTWNEVRELRAHGICFGSHTVNHPKLHELPWNAIENELKLSKACLEQELEEEIASFAYPYAFPQEDGHFTKMFTELCARKVTEPVSPRDWPRPAGDDLFCLRRLPANSCDTGVVRCQVERRL